MFIVLIANPLQLSRSIVFRFATPNRENQENSDSTSMAQTCKQRYKKANPCRPFCGAYHSSKQHSTLGNGNMRSNSAV